MKSTRHIVVVVGASLMTSTGLLLACSGGAPATGVSDAPPPSRAVATLDAGMGGDDAATPDPILGRENFAIRAEVTGGEDDTSFDAGFKPDTYDTELGIAACQTMARCCFGTENPPDGSIDGGSFNLTKCQAHYKLAGYDASNQDLARADAGVVVVDQVKAAACLQAVRSLSCTVTGPSFAAMREKCFGALYGTVPAGSACNYSIECVPGHFCKTESTDSGAAASGTCEPLRAENGSCGDFTKDQYIADHACSYRGYGETNRFCRNVVDFDTFEPTDPSQWTCQPALANGQDCTLNTWCTSGLCDFNNGKCVDTLDMYPQSFCKYYVAR